MRTSMGIAILFFLCLIPSSLSAADDTDPKELGGKSLEQWIKDIKDKDPGVCQNAIRTVVQFGKRGAKAAPALIDQLNHPDASIKANAAASLGMLSQHLSSADTERAIERLAIRMTEDRQAIVAFHAATALYYFANQARPVIPKLILATKADLTWELRRIAVMTLGLAAAPDGKTPFDIRPIKALVDASSDRCAIVRLEAVTSLALCGVPPSDADKLMVLHALQLRFKDSDDGVAIWAHAAYLYIDKMSDEHLASIANYLKSPKMVSRCQAARALGAIGKDAKRYVSKVIDLLKDKEPIAVFSAANALPNMGNAAKDAIPVIVEILQKKDLDEDFKASLNDCLKKLQAMKAN
jgi:HEAT repeat protein